MNDYGGRKAKSFVNLTVLIRRDFPTARANRIIAMMQAGVTYEDAVYATATAKTEKREGD